MIVCQNNQEVTYQGRVLALPRPVSPAKDEEGLPQPAFSPRSVLGGHGHGAETPPPSAAPATAGAGAPPPHRKDSCGSFAVPPICSLDDVIASADVILFNDDAFANINMNMNLVEDPPAPHNYYHETSAAAAACGSPYMLPDNAGGGLYPAQMQQQQQSPAALYSEYNNAATESGDTVVPQIMEGLVVRKGSEGSELLAALRRGAPPPPAKRRRKKQQQRQRALSPTPDANGTSGGGKVSGKVSPLSSATTQRKSGGCKKAGGGSRRRSSFPKATTAVLKGWLRTHFLNPYPSDLDKKQLCSECDLTMSQLQVRHTFYSLSFSLVSFWVKEVNRPGTSEERRPSDEKMWNNPLTLSFFFFSFVSADVVHQCAHQNLEAVRGVPLAREQEIRVRRPWPRQGGQPGGGGRGHWLRGTWGRNHDHDSSDAQRESKLGS